MLFFVVIFFFIRLIIWLVIIIACILLPGPVERVNGFYFQYCYLLFKFAVAVFAGLNKKWKEKRRNSAYSNNSQQSNNAGPFLFRKAKVFRNKLLPHTAQ